MDDLAIISQPYQEIYENLFREVNPNGMATVAAGEMAAFLKLSNINMQLLGQIWELADYQKRGVLDKRGAFIAFKLVAAAQQGAPIDQSSIYANGLNYPLFNNRTSTPSQQVQSYSSQPPPVQYNSHQWAIDPNDQAKYDSIFSSLNPINGKLPGSTVRPVLLNSGLSPTNLAKIWELADQDKDGQLDLIEMSIALHLVYRTLQNEPLPSILPSSLIHPSKAHLSRRTSTASLYSNGPPSAFPSQFGQNAIRSRTGSVASLDGIGMTTPSAIPSDRSISVQPNFYARNGSVPSTPTRGPGVSTPISTVPSSGEWPIDRLAYASQFAVCDSDCDGLVNGNDVKQVLLSSGVGQQVLAHIWQLADVNRTGVLNQEQFALTMHLIQSAKRGEQLPQTLPPTLLPPSLRQLSLDGPTESNNLNTSSAADADAAMKLASGSENPEMKQLGEEMEKLIIERRDMEAQVTQLEANMTVKNSEIKNLQVELESLEGTVKQLERQKAEAGRRLGDLDEQIRQLEIACDTQKMKAEETQLRLEQLKNDTEQGAATAHLEQSERDAAIVEMTAIAAERRDVLNALADEQTQIEGAVDFITKMETNSNRDEKQLEDLKIETEKAMKVLEDLKKLMEQDDPVAALKENTSLLMDIGRQNLLEDAVIQPSTSDHGGIHQPPDPFAETRSGAVVDPFAQTDPFAGSSAGFSAGFPSDPFGNSGFPTHQNGFGGDQTEAFGSVQAPPAVKAAPPRPAPPKSARQTPIAQDPFSNVDPFAGSQSSGGTGGFADFANFGTFN